MSMLLTTERITPAKAEAWLNKNNVNRKMREGVAEKYASDMKNGRWTQCPSPISFYENGNLADGQHRLWAIIDANTTITMPVVRGLTIEDGLNIDTGRARSLIDAAKISGADTKLSTTLVSLCRAIHDGVHSNDASRKGAARSNSEYMDIVTTYREAAVWAMNHCPNGRLLRNAIVMGAVARAWYHVEDHDRLARFGVVLGTGLYDNEGETAAIALRNYLFMKGSQTSSTALWRDTFLKCQNAINYFMMGKKLTAIKAVKNEIYPLKRARAKKTTT